MELDVPIGNIDAALISAQFGIVTGDFGQQAYQGVAARFADGCEVGGRSFKSPAVPAKEIDLPARIEPELIDACFKRSQQAGLARGTRIGVEQALRQATAGALDVVAGADVREQVRAPGWR